MANVTLKGVYKYYEKNPKPAVSDFDLEIADKEFIVFVGPSGCGKSTTLRMIAGLESVSDGEIYIGDKLVNNIEPKGRDIAMVFQNYALYPHMTVYKNMAFGLRYMRKAVLRKECNGDAVLTLEKTELKNARRRLKDLESRRAFYLKYNDTERVTELSEEIKQLTAELSKYESKFVADTKMYKKYLKARKAWLSSLKKSGNSPETAERKAELDACKEGLVPRVDRVHFTKKEIYEKVMEAAKILEIEEYLKRIPKELSGGQRQRVAIGRAIVRKPKVFLMDEPLSNLDAKLRNQMRAEIIELRKKVQTTFVYVTHDQVEAMTLGDRIVIMKDGFVQQIDTPKNVFEHPANLFVAGFIGAPQMNFFDAVLVKEDAYYVNVNGVRFALGEKVSGKLSEKETAEQDVVLGVRPEHIRLVKGGENAIKANIDICEMMGSEAHLHVTVGEKPAIIRVQTLDLDRETASKLSEGNEIFFTFPGKVMHIFDKETGNNLL